MARPLRSVLDVIAAWVPIPKSASCSKRRLAVCGLTSSCGSLTNRLAIADTCRSQHRRVAHHFNRSTAPN
jgi:hypothetical protein